MKYFVRQTGKLICLISLLISLHSENTTAASGIPSGEEVLVIADSAAFQRRWNHISETSAVIYWQLDSIEKSATSFVEYGTTEELGFQTIQTTEPRNAHLHRLKGLEPGVPCFYKMVVFDSADGIRKESEIVQFTPQRADDAIYIPQDFAGSPPYVLKNANAHYVLTQDIITNGTAIIIEGSGITLDLDGNTVTFGNNTSSQVFGVQITTGNNCKVVNGVIVQGERSADYCNAVRSFSSGNLGAEVCGISTDVHLRNAQPMAFRHSNLNIHHNHIYSRVIDLESRHYPGNALLRVETNGNHVHLHDNLFTEGCHRAILVSSSGTLTNVEINHNDIRHHQQYVNGYAIAPGSNAKVHHNRITSTGRGIHLSGANNNVYSNYIDIRGHQHLDDLPAGSRPFYHNLVELHGIKLEGNNSKNNKIYDNFVRITQLQPVDSQGEGHPDDKRFNGVYFSTNASSVENGKLVDLQQNWETDRWRYYFVKYDPNSPAVQITGNDATTLYGDFEEHEPGEYTVYMIWNYVPPTPLNLSCYDPNAMNEIYDNTFIGITTYAETRHGGYGDSGNWATALMLVGMDKGAADQGKYSAWIHDNRFYSNDLYVNSYSSVNMDILIENNIFNLTNDPFTTERTGRIRNTGAGFDEKIHDGSNVFNDSSTGVNYYKSSGIRIYPNPVESILNINLTESIPGRNNFSIWNMEGKKVMELVRWVSWPYQIDVSDLPRGSYIINVGSGDKMRAEKFFKY